MNIIVTARNPDGSAAWAHKDTLEAFVINNAVDLTFQDIENITATLGRGETWHGGGGATGAYTLEVSTNEDRLKSPPAQTAHDDDYKNDMAPYDYRYKAMLAALKVAHARVVEAIGTSHVGGYAELAQIAVIEAAIAKAEGRT